MAAVAAERLSCGGQEGEQLVSDPSCRRGGVCGECAMPGHLRLEHGPAIADLAPARLAAAWRMERIVTVQPGLLRRPVDMGQEYAVEQIQHVVLVAGAAADEHRPVLPGQDLLHPAAAPHPAIRPEPLLIGPWRPADPVAGGILPVRQLRVIVRIDRPHAAARQLPASADFPDPGFPVTRNSAMRTSSTALSRYAPGASRLAR